MSDFLSTTGWFTLIACVATPIAFYFINKHFNTRKVLNSVARASDKIEKKVEHLEKKKDQLVKKKKSSSSSSSSSDGKHKHKDKHSHSKKKYAKPSDHESGLPLTSEDAIVKRYFMFGTVTLSNLRCENLGNSDGTLTGKSDAYAYITLDGKEVGRTKTVNDNLSPEWNEEIIISVSDQYSVFRIEIWDDDHGGDEPLGSTDIPIKALLKSGEYKVDGVRLEGSYLGAPSTMSFKAVFKTSSEWHIRAPFPVRENCHVTLYQSAHCDEHDCPPPIYEKTKECSFKPEACWEEIYRKILFAKKFVCITGWSVNTNISLLRSRPIARNDEERKIEGANEMLTIGELLKLKAKQGLTVLVNVWNEAASVHVGGREVAAGLMATHDEETNDYFKGTGVHCRLSYRNGLDTGAKFVWTHHQKTIIVDEKVEGDESRRRLIAFIGGLDLCDGRWDTPSKPLFRTLQKEHANDFHQVWPGVVQDIGPRQPWQDIHSRVEGAIAHDIYTNFVERWTKQHPDLKDLLVDITQTCFLPEKDNVIQNGKETWTVQLLRSIDDTSSVRPGLEKSIQDSYINAIRRAERFIYVENQYFMGSSEYWNSPRSGCSNQIPIELTKRITYMISLGREFKVYIVMPMYPEGVPSDTAVQEIIYWQTCTREMMFTRIAKAIAAAGIDAHPNDYLNFYFVGKRESTEGSQSKLSYDACPEEVKKNDKAGFQKALAESRRYQIYVHSKMLIVDDIFIILGSANINERSMAGDRDTEICIGAFQPHYQAKNPYGKIHKFRMSVWAEHIGVSGPEFVDPQSNSCLAKVKALSEENFQKFIAPEVTDTGKGHIMPYPTPVAADGRLTAPLVNFPDCPASILGVESFTIPDKLTM